MVHIIHNIGKYNWSTREEAVDSAGGRSLLQEAPDAGTAVSVSERLGTALVRNIILPTYLSLA